MLLNCHVEEDSWKVPWTARRSNQSILKKSVLNIHWKDRCGSQSSNTLATWCEGRTPWKRPWCWERLKAGREGDVEYEMASPSRWTWVWASSGSWWRIGKPGMLQSMGSQRVGHDWATELKWLKYTLWEGIPTIELINTSVTSHIYLFCCFFFYKEHSSILLANWFQLYNTVLSTMCVMLSCVRILWPHGL